MVIGYYPEGETFGGTDKISHGAIPHFRDFINQEKPKWKHIIVEGDRFFRMKDVEWLINNFDDAKIFVLEVSREIENQRHKDRGDTQKEVWLKGRRTQIGNILTNMFILDKIQLRSNNFEEDAKNIKQEIMNYLKHLYQHLYLSLLHFLVQKIAKLSILYCLSCIYYCNLSYKIQLRFYSLGNNELNIDCKN